MRAVGDKVYKVGVLDFLSRRNETRSGSPRILGYGGLVSCNKMLLTGT